MFHSSPAASSLDVIGGPAILLGLVSLATDDHTMYAAVKVLHLVLTSNAMSGHLMRHISGYQVTAPSYLGHGSPRSRKSFSGPSDIPSAVTSGDGKPQPWGPETLERLAQSREPGAASRGGTERDGLHTCVWLPAPCSEELKNHLWSSTVSSVMAGRPGHGARVLGLNPAASSNLLLNLG